MMTHTIRHDWTREQAHELMELPFLDLLHRAQAIHREFHPHNEVQLCTLANIKSGGCPEDCAYCPQAARYHTESPTYKLEVLDDIVAKAHVAKQNGATRFCMGAAWREVRDNEHFDRVLSMVSDINAMGMEVCATLGMLTPLQAEKLKRAGLCAYNHNIDTSPDYYSEVISTRSFDDRIQTLEAVRGAGLRVCSGGIVGLGESTQDRADMLRVLANLTPQPDSVPINRLVAVEGTPLESQAKVPVFEWIRVIAAARIMMPKSKVRLAAGRQDLSEEAQTLAFMAGANSIFYGDKLLTTGNPEVEKDRLLMNKLGLEPMRAFAYKAYEEKACDSDRAAK